MLNVFCLFLLFLQREWHYKMNVSDTEASSVLKNLLQLYVQQKVRKSVRCCNYTNPYVQEQENIMASLFILIIVGFFGFLLFALMLSNIVFKKQENYMDCVYRETRQTAGRKLSPEGKLAFLTKNAFSELNHIDQCQKTVSFSTAPEAPSTESVLKSV